MANGFNIDEKDMIEVQDGLRKPVTPGSTVIKFDQLMKTADHCPFCGSGEKIKANGEIVLPFVVDRETSTWKTNCCGFRGGAINFTMNVHTPGENSQDEAIKWLKNFIKGK